MPIVVAVNKIDKADADPDRTRYELMKFNLIPEDLGGETLMVNVSAITKEGLPSLLENIFQLGSLRGVWERGLG